MTIATAITTATVRSLALLKVRGGRRRWATSWSTWRRIAAVFILHTVCELGGIGQGGHGSGFTVRAAV
uniref:Uncharacterized protein n=1 Tax=Anguilla anguilla TaxID=7936 RepID=A0A0E9VPW5_ANGAN